MRLRPFFRCKSFPKPASGGVGVTTRRELVTWWIAKDDAHRIRQAPSAQSAFVLASDPVGYLTGIAADGGLWYARRRSLRSRPPRDIIGSTAAERYPLGRWTNHDAHFCL